MKLNKVEIHSRVICEEKEGILYRALNVKKEQAEEFEEVEESTGCSKKSKSKHQQRSSKVLLEEIR